MNTFGETYLSKLDDLRCRNIPHVDSNAVFVALEAQCGVSYQTQLKFVSSG